MDDTVRAELSFFFHCADIVDKGEVGVVKEPYSPRLSVLLMGLLPVSPEVVVAVAALEALDRIPLLEPDRGLDEKTGGSV